MILLVLRFTILKDTYQLGNFNIDIKAEYESRNVIIIENK